MATPVLICDDSMMSRNLVQKLMPVDWDVDICEAENGAEGIQSIRSGKAELVFLDLNMPVMNGYEFLDAVRKENLKAVVIVISTDAQPQARERALRLGAYDFIQKPICEQKLNQSLQKCGLL